MPRYFVVSPAYGQDYSNRVQALEAWRTGKDFVHESAAALGGGRYCSIRDFKPGDKIEIRYRKRRQAVVETVKTQKEDK
jgi:hypothetical protein